jgi:MFS family permease
MLGVVKLKPKARFRVMSIGFLLSIPCFIAVYFSNNFIVSCVFAFLGGIFNCLGNSVFNASLMLALPQENRSAILGFINSASVGGTALSALIYGLLGELFPLYIVFSVGSAISLIPMIYLCTNKSVKTFILDHTE